MSNYNIKLQSNNTTLQRLIDNVNSLPDKGTDLPELTNPGTDSELFLGKELIDSDGNVVTGNFTIDNELSSQSNLLSQIEAMLENKSIGSGINFSIKAYSTEEALLADTPAENTIGVITENEITKYYFSATEPEGMLEGEAWFSIGTNSPVEFSLLKTTDVMIYPLSAKQRVNGELADVVAKSWQNGAWVDWTIYLYQNGDSCTGNGGAWVAEGKKLASNTNAQSAAPTITDKGDSVTITAQTVAGGIYRKEEKIRISNNFRLVFKGGSPDGYASEKWVVIWSDLDSYWDHNVVAKASIPDELDTTVTIDLSNFSEGNYYIGIFVYHVESVTMKEMYIE